MTLLTSKTISFVHPMLTALNLEDRRNAFCLLSSSPDTDYEDLVKSLRSSIPITMVGATSLGNPFDSSGEPFGTTMAFFGKKNVNTAVELSMPFTGDNAEELVADVHRRCLEKLGTDPKLYLIFLPVLADLFMDTLAASLFRIAGDIPVFGTMASCDFNSSRFAVFHDGACHTDRIVMVALGGEVEPVFGIGQEVTVPTDYRPEITEVDGNVVRAVDGVLFGEYLKRFDIIAETLQECPLVVNLFPPDSDDPARARPSVLVKIEDDQSGVLGTTPHVGERLGLGYISQENIRNSVSSCLEQLQGAMAEKEKNGYRFDLILAASCISRYYADGMNLIEADILNEKLPAEISKFGMYGYGEIGPVTVDGAFRNKHHGHALVMCAL